MCPKKFAQIHPMWESWASITEVIQAFSKADSSVDLLVFGRIPLEALTGDEKCGVLCIYAHSYVYGN